MCFISKHFTTKPRLNSALAGGDMSIQDLGSIGELIASIGVIVSLVYLALQVRQNTASNKILATQNLVTANIDINRDIAGDRERAELLQKSLHNGLSALTEAEQLQISTHMMALYHQFDLAYHQYNAGHMETAIWEKFEYEMPIWISIPVGKEWFERDKDRLSKSFVQFLESKVEALDIGAIPTLGREKDGPATSQTVGTGR